MNRGAYGRKVFWDTLRRVLIAVCAGMVILCRRFQDVRLARV